MACVWRGFGRPLPPLIRHLARWPMGGLALAIVAMVTIKGIIVRVEQKKLCEVKVESKKFGLLSHGGCSGVGLD